jgi:Flp pilus assembly protein TadD
MGRGTESEVVFRDLTDRRPKNAHHLGCLGMHLKESGRSADAAPILDRAIVAFREAIRLKPDLAEAHNCLGNALAGQGKVLEAIAEYREAIRLKRSFAAAHCNLGSVLRSEGHYAGSLAMYRKGHELGSRQPGWLYPSAQWVAKAERLASLAPRLPGLLKGEDRP